MRMALSYFGYLVGKRNKLCTVAFALALFGGLNVLPAHATILFQDDFEGGNFSKWNYVWHAITTTNPPRCYNWVSQTGVVHSGTHAARVRYCLGASATGVNRDDNNWMQKLFTPQTHFFIRGYLYFAPPTTGLGLSAQRKLYYVKENANTGAFHFVLGSFNMQLALAMGPPRDSLYQTADSNISWDLYPFQFNQWYSLEMETQLNTPGQRDGYVKVWVNGTQVLNRTGMNIRGDYAGGAGNIEIGNQLDTTATGAIEEYRYWDDIVIADPGPIGP